LYGLSLIVRPSALEKTEIFDGVFLTVEDYPRGGPVRGRVMIAEIHWDTPGIELAHRDFSYPIIPSDRKAPHFRTIPADLALSREKASLLMNTTLFGPNSLPSLIPGYGVRSLETIVIDGFPSHIHEHSYLLYWDSHDNVHMLRQKPPGIEDIEKAVLGIGLGGVQIAEARAAYNAIGSLEESMARTFIGVDPFRKILWLMAFEKSTGRFMIDRAVEEGVVYGGQLDGGSSTNLLIGSGAKDILPHTGIRSWRPIAPYLIIRANPL